MKNSESGPGLQIESWNQEETEKQQRKEEPRDYYVPPCNDGHLDGLVGIITGATLMAPYPLINYSLRPRKSQFLELS
jgi:hypothetical protein